MVWHCIFLQFFYIRCPLHLLSQVWGLFCALSVGERLGCCLVSVTGQESPCLKGLNLKICSAIAVKHYHLSLVMWLSCHIHPSHDLRCWSYFRIEEVWKLVLLNTNSRLFIGIVIFLCLGNTAYFHYSVYPWLLKPLGHVFYYCSSLSCLTTTIWWNITDLTDLWQKKPLSEALSMKSH